MWIKFNKLGIVQEYLKHGNLPEVGDTTFEIFAYFDDLDLNYYNTATIRFQKPDLSETGYPDLLMVQVQRKYVPYVGDSSSSFFQNDHYYTGYVFNFRDFEGPVGWENLPILLDTPGRWKATITLFPSSDAENESLRNVTGTIEFNVNNSVSYTDELDETNLDLTDIINNISHRLSTQVEKNSGNYVRMANNFTEKAESGELDPTTFLVGTFVYDLQTEKFYKILSTTESEAHPGLVEATYEDYKYILDREISNTTRISELYYKYKDQNIIYAEINGEKGFLTVENLVEENENQIVQFKIRFISKNIHRYAVYKSLQGPVGTVGRDFVTILTAEEDTQTEYGNVWVKNYAFDTDLEELDRKKQDVLIPGEGITIENNVISAAGSVVDSELDIDSTNPVQNSVVTENINDIRENYQEKLTAGEGVVIDEENVISVVPANDGVLTITQEGVVIGTFSANQAENTTINIDIPEDVVTSVNGKTGNVVLNANDVGALPISGGTLTGDLSTKKLTVSEEGIEIYDDTTPYIDFHYHDSSADYTARIIETPQGVLDIQGNSPYLTVNGNQVALKSATDDLANRISNLEDNSYVYTEDIVDNLTTDDATKVLSAKQGKVLKDTIDGLDLNQVGANGSYIKLISQENGQVSATAQAFDSSVSTSNPSTTNAPTTSAVKSYVDAYGGKIDSISIDGTAQTIDANKNVDLPAYPTKASLGLGNVDNTSDLNKPISTATQAALDDKQATLSQTQLDAVNSGITASLVSDINANTTARHTHSNKSILDGTTASFTTTLKDKLDGIESGAEVNDIDTISVNGTAQTITNKNVNISVPTQTSDLTNDGDGNSPFATEDYVDTYGGKIDSISINGTTQTIDANKNVDLPAYPTKSSLGLGSVVNTGDSATPTSGGTTKFTTGGAYTLQTTLQGNINTVDNKLNVNVHTEGNSDEITYNGDTVTKTSPYQNLKTGTTGTRSEVIHLANTTTAGLMSYTDYNQIRSNTARIEQLEGQTRRLLYTASQNPTQNDIATFVDNYLISIGITPSAEEYAGIAVVVAGTYHIWHYYDTAGVGWKDDGLDTVSQFTNSVAGIIQGKQADGFVYAENDGTGSVYGWSNLKTRVSNVETGMVSNVAYDTTNKKITKTINGATSDVVTTATIKSDLGLATVATSGSYNDLSDKPNIPEYSLDSSTTTSTGAIKYLEDITYTSASASGTDTFVKTINGGSGSFTPTTRYLHSNTTSVVTGMTFNSASAVTGVNGGSMVGTRSTSGSGTSERRTLSISFTPATVSGAIPVMTGVSQTSTDNVITSISVNTSAATGDITYLESATHTHTGASVGTSASAVTGITAGSVTKTTKYATLEEN